MNNNKGETPMNENRMAQLSSALDVCAPLLEGKLVYLDYPIHGNVGDLLIWMGAKEFFRRNGKKFLGQYFDSNIGTRARRHLDQCTTICFHGGGNFGDLWPWHQKLREDVIQKYPHKRIVILPQSVHFGDMRELDKACKIVKNHPDVHIFLRDKNSFSLLQERGVPNLKLCPDMAHALWGTFSAPNPSLASPLYLLRRDKEDGSLPPEVDALRSGATDWEDILTGWTERAYQFGRRVNEIDGRRDNILPAYTVWSAVSKIIVHRAVGLFAPHETIITNRLHAMILAALLERKAVVFDNSYGKISSYADLWMKDVPGITLQKQGGA
jgi:pyruvyl transferase EpsO